MASRLERLELHCLLKMWQGLLVTIRREQRGAQVLLGKEIVFCNVHRVRPEIDGTSPVSELIAGEEHENPQNDYGNSGARPEAQLPAICQVSCTPDHHHKDSNQRDVSVAVGDCLLAYLDKSNDRNQSSEEPEPADEQVGPGSALLPDQRGHGEHKKRGHSNLPTSERSTGVGIKYRQSRRPECFPHI